MRTERLEWTITKRNKWMAKKGDVILFANNKAELMRQINKYEVSL